MESKRRKLWRQEIKPLHECWNKNGYCGFIEEEEKRHYCGRLAEMKGEKEKWKKG